MAHGWSWEICLRKSCNLIFLFGVAHGVGDRACQSRMQQARIPQAREVAFQALDPLLCQERAKGGQQLPY